MKTHLRFLCLCLAMLATGVASRAQLTGTVTVPSTTYPDLASVITALNTQGVGTGGCTVTIASGNAQTAPAAGYQLGSAALNASLSAANALIINGNGNTVTGQTGTGAADGIFWLLGTDYVTINGLNLTDVSTTTTSTSTTADEWGFVLGKRNTTAPYDGCQHVTINNCTISLNKYVGSSTSIGNTSTNIIAFTGNSTGILAAHVTPTSTSLSVIGYAASDANSYNTFTANTITNVTRGIYLGNGISPGSVDVYDKANRVGGLTSASGNTITVGGTSLGNSPLGVVSQYDSVITVQNNKFYIGSGQTGSGTICEHFDGIGVGDVNVLNNYFNIACSVTTASVYGYLNSYFQHTDAGANFNFTGNEVTGNITTSTTGYIGAMYNYYNAYNILNVSSNNIHDIDMGVATSSSAYFYGLYSYYNTVGTTINANSNRLYNLKRLGTTPVLYFYATYFYDYPGSLTRFNFNNNSIRKLTTCANYTYVTYNYGPTTTTPARMICNYNRIDSIDVTNNTTSYDYIYNYLGYYSGDSSQYNYDTLTNFFGAVNGFSNTSNYSYIYNQFGYCYYGQNGSTSKGNYLNNFSGNYCYMYNYVHYYHQLSDSNTFSNMYVGVGTGGVSNNGGITNFLGYYGTNYVARNHRVYNMSAPGTSQTIYNYTGYYGTLATVYNNVIRKISGNSTIYNYTMYGPAGGGRAYNNIIDSITIGGSGICYAWYSYGNGTDTLYNNKVSNIIVNGTGNTIYGYYLGFGSSGFAHNFYNNIMSNIELPSTYLGQNVYGIYTNGTGDYRLYDNTIRISPSATITGGNVGATGIYYLTTGTLDLRNNIINVNVTPTGTGLVAALRRNSGTTGTSPSNFLGGSNSNIYYAPNVTNSYLYAEGTSSTTAVNTFNLTNDPGFNTSCGLFKSFMGHDYASFTENNLSPASAGPSTYAPTGLSYAKSGAAPVSAVTITSDYAGVTRPNPADIGALQFAGTAATDNAPPQISYTPVPTSSYCISAPIITATITDQTGVDTTAGKRPRLYYKKSTENNAFGGGNTAATNGWKYVDASPGISGNTYTFALDFSLLNSSIATGNTIQYFIIAQDLTASTNTGASVVSFPTCATSVALTVANGPTNASPAINAFTILTTPTFNVVASSPAICNSGSTTVSVNPSPLGATVQWQSAPGGSSSFTNISGATGYSYTSPILTSTIQYRAILYCGASTLTTLAPVTISVNNPQILTTTNAAQCGYGSATVSATTNPGTTVNWYTTASGGSPVATGNSYLTPPISNSVTYYAAGVVQKGQVDILTKALPASYYSYFTWTNYGNDIRFLDTTDFYSTTVYAMSTTTGTVYVELYDSASGYSTLQKTAGPFTVTGAGTTFNGKYVLNLNWTNIPPGRYRMVLGASSTAQLHYEYQSSPALYPMYSVSSGRSQFVGAWYGSPQSNYYFGFYDNKLSGSCENSTRYPVTVTVTPAPPIAASSPNTPGICSGSNATITATSTNGTYLYTWQPGALSGATQTVSPSATTTYVVNAVDVLSGCKAIDSVTINVNPQQAAPTLSPMNQTICEKSVIQITATPTTPFGGTGTVGTGTTQNSIYGWPSAFGGYYQGHHEQYLIKASELSAAGIQAGALTSVAYDITAAVPASSLPLRNFVIRIAPTTQTAITALQTTGFTTVLNAATFTPAGSTGWQVVPFTNAFQWNGSTNIILDIAEYNCTTCPTSACSWSSYPGNATQNSTVTTFNSSVYYYGVGDCSITSLNPTGGSVYGPYTSTQRPNMRFTWSKPYNINWTNVTGLYKSYPPLANPLTLADTVTKVYASPVTTQVYRAYTNAVGCISALSAPDTLFVNPAPNVVVTPAGSQTICAGQTVTLSVPTGGTNIYQWYVNGAKITTNGTTNAYIVSAAGTYRVAVTNLATGCADTSINTTVIVNPLPTNTVTASGATTFCNGGSVVLTSASTSSPVLYQWYQNGVAIPAAQGGNLPTYTATTSGTYYSVVTNVNQCTQQSNAVSVTVNTIPNTITSLGSTTFCTSGSDTLSAPTTGTGAPYTYLWYYNGTPAPTPNTNSNYVATASGTYYAIISSASTGCSVTSTNTTITVGAAPSSAITPTGAQGLCSGDSLTLTTNTSSGLTITWYKNGVSTGQTTSSIVVKTAGSYTANVAITAQPSCNSTSSTATVVTINPLPAVSISAGSAPTTFCMGGSVTLTATGTGITTWQWYNNGVAVPGANSATYNALTGGSYTAVGTNGNGCKGTSNAVNVTVNPLPVIAATASGPTTFCNGGSVVLSASPATYTSYVWKNGATTVSSGATATSYTATQNGQYSVTVTNSNNCSNTSATVNVQVNPTPDSTVSPASGNVNICQGATTTLCGAITNPAYTYQWRNGASNIGGATNKCYTTGTAGSYTLRVTNSVTGCSSTSQTLTVIINTPPTALATRVGPATICAGDSSKLAASTGPSYTYQWYYNNTPIPFGGVDSVYYAKLGGSYTVKITNIGGCATTSNAVAVTVNPTPAAYITYNTPVSFCEGSAVVLTANGGTSLTYQWLINDTVTNNTSTSFIATTTGIYTVKTTNNFGCSTQSDTLHVSANPKPNPVIDRKEDTVYVTQAYANYQWFFNNNAIGGATLPFYKYAQNGAYKVRVIDANGCEGYSELMFIQNVGVTPNAISAAIKVFPNPTTGLLRIEAPVKVKLTLRDVTGKAVIEATAVKELDITAVANGMYLLYISDMDGKLLRADKVTKTAN